MRSADGTLQRSLPLFPQLCAATQPPSRCFVANLRCCWYADGQKNIESKVLAAQLSRATRSAGLR